MRRRDFLLTLGGVPALALARQRAVEFATVQPGYRLKFPADHGAHPQFRTEWWYVTGWLETPGRGALGFQCTFFRVRTGYGEDNPSLFAPRQLILAHAAIADPTHGRLRHDQRAARSGSGRAGFSLDHTQVWLDDWRLEQAGDSYRVSVAGDAFAYDLQLTPPRSPLLNGQAGFSAKAENPKHASYYYSRPQLRVSGEVGLPERRRAVTGKAWLDHEWSSELLPTNALGWDWIGINLADGGAIMAFRLRDADGATLWAGATVQSANGIARTLDRRDISFESLRQWQSPRSGVRYPVEWNVRVGEQALRVSPLLDDQELDSRMSTGTIYWEGAVVASAQGTVLGHGYLELTGYGGRVRVG